MPVMNDRYSQISEVIQLRTGRGSQAFIGSDDTGAHRFASCSSIRQVWAAAVFQL
jgi:hypothetical protein